MTSTLFLNKIMRNVWKLYFCNCVLGKMIQRFQDNKDTIDIKNYNYKYNVKNNLFFDVETIAFIPKHVSTLYKVEIFNYINSIPRL